MTALLFWHSANGAAQGVGGPGSGCFLDSAVGRPALFSPDTGSVLAVIGGLLRIGLGISTSASLGMNGSFDCQRCLWFLRNNLPSSVLTV